jgi:hypothetical protein
VICWSGTVFGKNNCAALAAHVFAKGWSSYPPIHIFSFICSWPPYLYISLPSKVKTSLPSHTSSAKSFTIFVINAYPLEVTLYPPSYMIQMLNIYFESEGEESRLKTHIFWMSFSGIKPSGNEYLDNKYKMSKHNLFF